MTKWWALGEMDKVKREIELTEGAQAAKGAGVARASARCRACIDLSELAAELLVNITGQRPVLMRPPFGAINVRVMGSDQPNLFDLL